MKLVDCERCGSRELIEDGDHLVCIYCQSKYLPAPAEPPMISSIVGVGSDIDALLQKCRNEPENRRRYASLVLDLDPSNEEAQAYLR